MKTATTPPKRDTSTLSSASGRASSSTQAPAPRDVDVPSAVERHIAEAASQAAATPAPSAPARATFLHSFVYAWDGVCYVVHTQRNMRVHLTLGVLAVALGIYLRVSPVEWGLVFVAIALVLVSEMMNTVVEAVVDLASPHYHPLAKVAKDAAAGAVLLNALLAVIIALCVFIPHLWPLALRLFGR